MSHRVQDVCRICSGSLRKVLDLGKIYPSNFVDKTEGKPVPLALVECKSCGLVQLEHTVDLDEMYRNYFYQSGINPSMQKSLQDIVEDVEKTIQLQDRDIVIDIGCNDGTMFKFYKNKIQKIGFDPAFNLHDKAIENCDFFFNTYFSKEDYIKMFGEEKAKVITAIAMFYDLPFPNIFVQDVASILADDGIFVIQFTDLISMLKINAVDNICHEHLEYYKLSDIRNLLDKFGLDVFKVSYNTVNGGSLRVFAGRNKYHPIQDSVLQVIAGEKSYLDSFTDPMKAFAERISRVKHITLDFLTRAENAGVRLYGMGASTKGNTLLQYFGITKRLIPVIADVNPDKFGKFTIGSNIPIVCEEDAFKEHPEMFFVLPWHFIEDFISRNKAFLEDGGAFIVPLPEPVIYYLEEGGIKWTLLEKVLG